jgi:hypothetical protein
VTYSPLAAWLGPSGVPPTDGTARSVTVADEQDGYYIVAVPATGRIPRHWHVSLSGVGDVGKAATLAGAQRLADDDFSTRNKG